MLGFYPIASAPIADEGIIPTPCGGVTVPATDVLLRGVPSDTNRNDVRLYDPTCADADTPFTVTTSAEAYSDATMAVRVTAAITTAAEQSSAETLAERYVIAIASVAEQYSAVVGAEREVDTIASVAEQYSDAALSVTVPPAVSLAIATSAEQSSAATIGVGAAEAEGPDQGRGGRYVDPFQSYPQKLTVRVVSETEVSSDAVMGVRIPVKPIPRVTMRVASDIGAARSQARLQERIGARIETDNLSWGSDSTFEETISGVEYDRLKNSWEEESYMIGLALEMMEVD